MKKIALSFLVPFTIFASSQVNSQEIDASIINDLSPDQVVMAKRLLDRDSLDLPVEEDASAEQEESLKINELSDKSAIQSTKFGYSFISTSPTSIIATGDLPLPNNYKISLGDTIGVVLSGSKEGIFEMKVQLDGTVFFPELGSISVVGESFQDIKTKFSNLINQSFIGVSVDLSLKNLSAKKITIVGTVNNPGTYLVNPFTTISNSLAYSGGINEIGTLRNIQLIRSNGERFVFDLYDLLINGDRTNDITIESGDVIVVGAASKFINITGMVRRPGSYEILPNEDLSDLLNYALGFSGGANVNKITLEKLDLERATVTKVITKDISHTLKDIISVKVFAYLNNDTSNIYVDGAVKEPGYYDLENFKNLEELINRLEFIDVYPWLATLEQFDDENLVKSTTLFNLNDPNTYRFIKLLPNSKIYFANLNARSYSVDPITLDLIDDYSLNINHKQNSFNMPVFGRYSVKSFIDLLGLDMANVDEEATYISPIENIVLKDNFKNMHFSAVKYNTVSFRSPINDLISITIEGAVDYPGEYTLQSNSTLQDLYEMVGDFKVEAFEEGIIFTRESIRERQLKSIEISKQALNRFILTSQQQGKDLDVNIISALSETITPDNLGRIAGDFSPESASSIKTILMNGDQIIIPVNPNAINVLGEVLNPIAFEYSKELNVRSAVEMAGGYQDFADKRKVYVIKANGLIERANRSIFVKNVGKSINGLTYFIL